MILSILMNLMKDFIDKKDFNDIDIYYLGYQHKKKITEFNVINSVNALYLRIRDMRGQF